MYRKKVLALILVLIMGIGMLTGCSPAEKGYFNMMNEVSNLKVYEDTGTIQLSLVQLPNSLFTGENALDKELIQKTLDQYQIEYQGKVDVNQNSFQYDFNIVNTVTAEKYGPLSLIYKNNVFYLKVDKMISYLKQFANTEQEKNMVRLLSDVEYISLSSQELDAMMPEGSQTGLGTNLLQKSVNQQKIWMRLYDGLINNVYDDYQSNLVTENNNKNGYIVTLRGSEVINILQPFATYTINNIDKLGKVLKSFVNGLSETELIELGLNNQIKTEALPLIDLMVTDVTQNRAEYLSQIEILKTTSQQEILDTLNDTEIVSSMEKTDAQTYNGASKLHLHITAGIPAESMELNFEAKDMIKIKDAVNVVAPTTKVKSFSELQSELPKSISINVDQEYYTFDNGFNDSYGVMTVEMIDDYAYLPLRQVGEMMGEKVGWDQTLQQAYVLRNGERMMMTTITSDDCSFVKVRDFEKLGYKINWDAATLTVRLEK